MQQQQTKYKFNNDITANEIRLVMVPPGYFPGIYSFRNAYDIAIKSNLDLIQISPNGQTPAVCKIMEISKFNYELKQKEKAMKKSQKGGQLKEIWLGWDIAINDMQIKARKTIEFLNEGNKVKVAIKFKGRENLYANKGELVMLNFAEMVSESGIPEYLPKFEGKQCHFILKPISKKQ